MHQGTRFVEIPAETLLSELNSICDAIKGKGGKAEKGQQGREVVYDFTPPRATATVRLYTTLSAGAQTARNCGEDAVRIVVGAMVEGRFRTLTEPRKMLRTAPQGEHHERVRTFLDRLTEALRVAYGVALKVPMCPLCRGPMSERSTKPDAQGEQRRFYGCLAFPTCRGTKPFPKNT